VIIEPCAAMARTGSRSTSAHYSVFVDGAACR
jgi:hypothetical protein